MAERLHLEAGELTSVEEARQAEEAAKKGLYQTITDGQFPGLSQQEPHRLAIYKLEAIRAMMREYSSARALVRDDENSTRVISVEMVRLLGEAYKICEEAFPKAEGEQHYPMFFYLDPSERNTLEIVVECGFVEALTFSNMPSLAGLPPEDLIMLKLRTITNALVIWRGIESDVKSSPGYITEGNSAIGTFELASGRIKELEFLREELSQEFLSR